MYYKFQVARPDLRGNELKYVTDAIQTGWVSSNGPYVERLEKAFAEYVGTKYAVSCSSGTTALFLALKGLGIGPGDEVIVPEFTMVASAWAVLYTGATPIFVDCGDDLNIDVKKIEEKLTSRTRAIMPVHIYGRVCDMASIQAIAKKHDLLVVEDACEAHGATYRDRKVGSLGNAGCFSLYGNKILTAGEGGLVTTDDPALYEEMVKLRGMYFEPNHTFLHQKVGYNYRMPNLSAAVALAQLEHIEFFLSERERVRGWYDEYLGGYSIPRPEGSVLWMYDIVVDEEKRDPLMAFLSQKGIETRIFFKPMSMQPMFQGSYGHLKAYAYSKSGCYLPAYTRLQESEVRNIAEKVSQFLTS